MKENEISYINVIVDFKMVTNVTLEREKKKLITVNMQKNKFWLY